MTEEYGEILPINDFEYFDKVRFGEYTIIINVSDNPVILGKSTVDMDLGAINQLGGDFSSDEKLLVFSNEILLADDIRCGDLTLCASRIKVLKGMTIDASGEVGKSERITSKQMDYDYVDLKNGESGEGGATVNIYTECLTGAYTQLKINTTGGDGGNGQNSYGKLAANGGIGGKGGDVNIYYKSGEWYMEEEILKILKTRNTRLAKMSILKFMESNETFLQENNQLSKKRDEIKKILMIDIDERVFSILKDMYEIITRQKNKKQGIFLKNIHCYGGFGGNAGICEKNATFNGISGEKGGSGNKKIREISALDLPTEFIYIHPDYCEKLINKMKIDYLIGFVDKVDSNLELLKILDLKINLLLNNEEKLSTYISMSKTYGIYSVMKRMQILHNDISNLMIRMGNKLLSFDGKSKNYTSLLSMSTYNELLELQMQDLEKIERRYKDVRDKNNEQSKIINSINTMRHSIENDNRQSKIDNNILLKLMSNKYDQIIQEDKLMISFKEDVIKEKGKIQNKIISNIKNHFNFSVDAIINALEMCIFCGGSMPMVGVELGSILYQGSSTVVDKNGFNVSKEVLINEVKYCGSNLDEICEGYQDFGNGKLSIDDPGGHKLIVYEQEFYESLEEFYRFFDEDLLTDFKEKFSSYLGEVHKRNNMIYEYNIMLDEFITKENEMIKREEQMEVYNKDCLLSVNAELPVVNNFFESLYTDSLEKVFKTLLSISRSYKFWSLTDENILQKQLFKYSWTKFDYATMLGFKQNYMYFIETALEKMNTSPRCFNDIEYALSSEEIDVIKKQNENNEDSYLTILLPPISNKTTKVESSFAGMSTVRVNRVRIWLDGAETSDREFEIDIEHDTDDYFTNIENNEFYFEHDPVLISFAYKQNEGEVKILKDGDLNKDNQVYINVGLFTRWNLKINQSKNLNLNLNQLKGIKIMFSGTYYPFKS